MTAVQYDTVFSLWCVEMSMTVTATSPVAVSTWATTRSMLAHHDVPKLADTPRGTYSAPQGLLYTVVPTMESPRPTPKPKPLFVHHHELVVFKTWMVDTARVTAIRICAVLGLFVTYLDLRRGNTTNTVWRVLMTLHIMTLAAFVGASEIAWSRHYNVMAAWALALVTAALLFQ